MKALRLNCIAIVLTVLLSSGAAEASGNLMGGQSSPYLQLHADDLVHWRPWGKAALAEAAKSDKPIFLSIGYLSCHWCHVMRRESFKDVATASLINTHFVPILIDREEMPSLDSSFQSAAVLLGLSSGWPLSLFLTADGKPFWGGTYFPKDEVAGIPPFTYILQQISAVYRDQPGAVRQNADGVTAALNRIARVRPGSLSMDDINAAARIFAGQVNPFYGGFGDAPLFPMTVAQDLLWRAYIRTGGETFKEAVTTTLDAMVRGGVYDQVGGGFFRYAVDPEWNVPHFEKMLNINAAMVRLMAEVWRETGDEILKTRVYETVTFLLREMRLNGGAFASALDADSLVSLESEEEEEGAFYVWNLDSIEAVLGDDTELLLQLYDIAPTETGEKDDPGILYQNGVSLRDVSTATQLDDKTIQATLKSALKRLYLAREKRPRPRLDTKVLADWNALVIVALSEAGLAFNEPTWIETAEKAYRFVINNLTGEDGRLYHSWSANTIGVAGNLDDLASMSSAAMALFQATGKKAYLKHAHEWTDQANDFLWDKAEGGFFATQSSAAPQLVRAKPIYDGTEAAGNAQMISVLARLYYLGGENKLMKRAETTLKAFSGFADEHLLALSGLLNAAETLRAALQIVIIGERGEPGTDALLQQVAAISLPNKTVQVIGPGADLPEGHPARYKEQIEDRATAYVCRGNFCSLPAASRDSLAETLHAMRKQSQ
jgi:uncharacterized protein